MNVYIIIVLIVLILQIKSKSIDKTINENNINYFNKDIIEVEQPKVIKITKKIKQV